MRSSIKLGDQIYVNSYGILSIVKNIGNTLSSKHSKESLMVQESATNALKLLQKKKFRKQQKHLVI